MANNKFQALGLQSDDSEAEEESSKKLPPPIPLGPGHHRLQSSYSLWFSRKAGGGGKSGGGAHNFDQNLRLLGRFASCEQFWNLYSHLAYPSSLGSHSDYHLFKDGIKPMWEDKANCYGGKWIVRLRKGIADRCWENLILAMIGEQFMVGDEICGAVVSVRFQEDILSIWNRSANDHAITSQIRTSFRRVLNLPSSVVCEYKAHNDSIKDHSSFRNTDFLR